MAVDVADAVLITELRSKPAGAKLWPAVWPKLVAVVIFIGVWQAVVWSHWKAEYIVPSPFTVLRQFGHDAGHLTGAVGVTMRRAAVGFGLSMLLGGALGLAVARGEGSPGRHRVDDHGPADDAIRCVGSARYRAVPAQ